MKEPLHGKRKKERENKGAHGLDATLLRSDYNRYIPHVE